MIRKAFRMEVHQGQEAEYARRHAPIWRELEDVLVEHGVRSYSIYLDPHTNDLFGYLECDSDAAWNAVAETDVCRRWWRFMRESCLSMPTTARSLASCAKCFISKRREAAVRAFHAAIDLGAGSGRVFLGEAAPDAVGVREVHRFHYPPRPLDGHLRWDLPGLWKDSTPACTAHTRLPVRPAAS